MSFKQIISALRMGLAVAAALFSSILFRLENPYWAPTTIMVVEGINFGAFSKKLFPVYLEISAAAFQAYFFLLFFHRRNCSLLQD